MGEQVRLTAAAAADEKKLQHRQRNDKTHSAYPTLQSHIRVAHSFSHALTQGSSTSHRMWRGGGEFGPQNKAGRKK